MQATTTLPLVNLSDPRSVDALLGCYGDEVMETCAARVLLVLEATEPEDPDDEVEHPERWE